MSEALTPTLFERLGGMVSIDVAVDRFYERVVGVPELAAFFDPVDLHRLRAGFAPQTRDGSLKGPLGAAPFREAAGLNGCFRTVHGKALHGSGKDRRSHSFIGILPAVD